MRAGPIAAATSPLERLTSLIRPHGRLAVLLSGGVDSSLVAAAAAHALGPAGVLALTIHSPLTPPEDTEAARGVAALLGVRHLVVETDTLGLPEVALNGPRRCYACKRGIIGRARGAARREGFGVLAEGSNADDVLAGERPGLAAVREAGLLSPLAAAGLAKEGVRALARALSLPVWDRPSAPCLATRFPTGHRLEAAEVALIHSAERELRGLGLRVVRLRHRGPGEAALEVAVAELEAARRLRSAIGERLRTLGLRLSGPALPYGQRPKETPVPQRDRGLSKSSDTIP